MCGLLLLESGLGPGGSEWPASSVLGCVAP